MFLSRDITKAKNGHQCGHLDVSDVGVLDDRGSGTSPQEIGFEFFQTFSRFFRKVFKTFPSDSKMFIKELKLTFESTS